MAYHHDLLQQARRLAHQESKRPKQASLRRAVSTAYYALFHYLVAEAVANWRQVELRAAFSRGFEHNMMKAASNRVQDRNQFPFTGESPEVVATLKAVAKTFVHLQDKRHIADYDNATIWTRTQAVDLLNAADRAIHGWASIRHEQIAQSYLLSMIVKKRD